MSARVQRSTRNGWTLVQLANGVYSIVASGDRDVLATRRDSLVRATFTHHQGPGNGVALYDANGALRDGTPFAPKLASGGSCRWPATLPTAGTVAQRYTPPAMDADTKRLMDSLRPKAVHS